MAFITLGWAELSQEMKNNFTSQKMIAASLQKKEVASQWKIKLTLLFLHCINAVPKPIELPKWQRYQWSDFEAEDWGSSLLTLLSVEEVGTRNRRRAWRHHRGGFSAGPESWQMWHHMSSLANYSHDTKSAGRREPSEDQCWFLFQF